MKVLILYVSTNSGHQRAAIAVEKALRRIDREIEIVCFNYLGYVSPLWEKTVTYLYFSWIKIFPGIWNRLYDHAGVSKRISPFSRWINNHQSKRFNRFLEWFRPDVVVCTQAFPCGVVASFKRKTPDSFKLMAVATDYIAHIYWVYDEVDIYMVATEKARMDLIDKGVDAKKIKILGIPIDLVFAQQNKRSQIALNLGISPEKTTVLIMGGGQGYGPLEDIAMEILNLNLEIQILIITGTNEFLQKRLISAFGNIPGVKIFGFVGNVSEIMDVCDVVITKPGGLTTAEAMAKGLPMILTLPIPGQEEKNREFFISGRMAFAGDSPKDTAGVLKRFLLETEILEEYKRNISRHARPSASLEIAKEVVSS